MIDTIPLPSLGIKKDLGVSLERSSKDHTELEWAPGCPEVVTWARGHGPEAPERFTLYNAQHR